MKYNTKKLTKSNKKINTYKNKNKNKKNIKQSKIDDYKIINELGFGMRGTVYLVSKKDNRNKKYAMKIEHILESDIKNPNSSVWKEINFSKNFGNKYPDQFITLLDYDIINNCKHIQKYPLNLNIFNLKKQNEFKELSLSPYCMRKIYTLIDGVLKDIIKTLSHKQIYSMIIQVVNILELIHLNKYTYWDLNDTNIAYVKTKQEFIKIKGYKVPTFGYLFKIIDYGLVDHISNIHSNFDLKTFNLRIINDSKKIIESLYESRKIWLYMSKYNIPSLNFQDSYENFIKTDDFKYIKTITDDKYLQMKLFYMINPRLYQQLLLNKDFKKTIPIKIYLPIEDIIFFISSKSDSDVMDYFIKKLIQ
jgi:hypothetical protein